MAKDSYVNATLGYSYNVLEDFYEGRICVDTA